MSFTLLVKTYRDLWLRKGLVFSLSLVLAIATSAYIGMASVYLDMKMARDQYYQHHQLADFTILCSAVPRHIITVLKQNSNIKNVQGRLRTRIRLEEITGKNEVLAGEAYSLPSFKNSQLNSLRLHSGRYPHADSNEMVVLSQFFTAHHLLLGQSIPVIFPAGVRLMRIVGEAYSPEHVIVASPDAITLTPQESRFGVIYVSETTLADLSGLPNQYNEIMVKTRDTRAAAVSFTMNQVAHELQQYGVKFKYLQKDQFSVNLLDSEIKNIQVAATIFPTLFLLVGALVINVLLQRLVKQQYNIIGMLKAIGTSRFTILCHYLSYGILIGVIGSTIGLGLGLWLQKGLVILYQGYFQLPLLKFHLHAIPVIIGMSVSVLAALLGSIMSTLHATRLSPVQAMHSQIDSQTFSNRSWKVKSWLSAPFYVKMALRSIFRDVWRSAISVLTVIIGLALLYTAFTMKDSMLSMVDFSITNMNHFDAAITLAEPVNDSILDSLYTLPGVKAIETQFALPVTLRSGSFHKEIVVEGLPRNNRLFTPVDRFNIPIRIPVHGLVLSRTLAKLLHVGIGDRIVMQPLLGHREPILTTVAGLVTTYLGLPAYANQIWLSHNIDSSLSFNKIFIKFKPGYSRSEFKHGILALSNINNIQYAGTIKQEIATTVDQFLGGFIFVITLFAATIAITSMYNNAMVSISERQRDVATFSVLGLQNWEIFRIFCVEAIILWLVGVIIGCPLAYYYSVILLQSFQTEFFRFPVQIYFSHLIESIIMMLLFFILSSGMVLRYICKTSWQGLLNVRE